MKTIPAISATICILALAVAGCGQDDDIQSGQAFLEAFPLEETLIIPTGQTDDLGGGLATTQQALVGDRADLHDLSFFVAFQVNGQARRILTTIWFITRFQPTLAVLEDGVIGEGDKQVIYDARAVWGPFPDNEGKNLEFILHVWRGIDPDDGRRTFVYYAAGRERGSQNAWIPFVAGGAKPRVVMNGELMNRKGLVEVDCDAIQILDPTEDDVGNASYYYEVGDGYYVVAAVGEGVWSDYTQTAVTDATYIYGRSRDGYRVLEFDTSADIQNDAGDALETLHVVTGWLDNGDGRSDASVSGGDLNAAGEDLDAALTECWGRDKRQTYFHFTGADVDIEDGSVSACFAAQPIDLPEIDYEAIRDTFDLDF